MKKFVCSIITCFVISCIFLTGCQKIDPPGIDYISECFIQNRQDILTIAHFLIKVESDYISIKNTEVNDTECKMLNNLTKVKIPDPYVCIALRNMKNNDAFKLIIKDGNTISIMLWNNIFGVDCGVAYSINGMDLPDVEFCTELVPLKDEAWYYYVADYEKWRGQVRQGDDFGDKGTVRNH